MLLWTYLGGTALWIEMIWHLVPHPTVTPGTPTAISPWWIYIMPFYWMSYLKTFLTKILLSSTRGKLLISAVTHGGVHLFRHRPDHFAGHTLVVYPFADPEFSSAYIRQKVWISSRTIHFFCCTGAMAIINVILTDRKQAQHVKKVKEENHAVSVVTSSSLIF